MRIFINPGHKIGEDPGACGFGLQEAQVAFNISKRVEFFLNDINYTVKLFAFDGLDEIVDVANYWNPDLFISIHCNAFDSFARGTETYYGNSIDSYNAASAIHNQILNRLPTIDRGVKSGSHLFVLKHTNCPSVLVETAFIDNPADSKLLIERQEDFARAIACGITDAFAN